MHGAVHTFIGRGDGNSITLQSSPDAATARRWMFSEIRPQSFKWENYEQLDGTWVLVQDFAARRRVDID